jgi:hypothetical protein
VDGAAGLEHYATAPRINMPNGFQGSDLEWQRIEAPLLRIDSALEMFASAHGLTISKNYHNHPERSLTWGAGSAGLRRLIQLYLTDSKLLTFNIWLCASQDRGSSRYWKQEFLLKEQSIETFVGTLPSLLEGAYLKVNSWAAEDLERAG